MSFGLGYAAILGSSGVPVIFAPSDLGTLLLESTGDDPGNIYTFGDSNYESLANNGTIGGAITSVAGKEPPVVTSSSRNSPKFLLTDQMNSPGVFADYTRLHDPTGVCSVTIRFYINALLTNQSLFVTTGSWTPGIGLYMPVNRQMTVFVGRVYENSYLTSAQVLGIGWHTVTYTKTGLNLGISVDGETLVTTTLPDAGAQAPVRVPIIGNHINELYSSNSVISAIYMYDTDIGQAGADSMHTYLSSEWSAVPT